MLNLAHPSAHSPPEAEYPFENAEYLMGLLGIVPTALQKTVLQCAKRFILVAGGEQAGKELDVDTPISTLHGWKRMGDIRVGDIVFDQTGEPTLVEWVSQIETKPAYCLKFDNGTEIVASGTHQWLVRNYNARKHGYKPKVRTTDELLQGGLKRPFSNWSIASPLPIQCPEQILPVDPYLFGAWLGDGSKGAPIIHGNDPEIFTEIESRGIPVAAVASKAMAYTVGAKRELTPKFRKMGVLGAKSIPQVYLRASYQQRLDLLRGLMDTDGYVDKRGRLSFTNTNKKLIDGFVELVAGFGMSFRVREGRATLYGKDCGPKWDVEFQTKLRVFNLSRKAGRQQPEKFSSRSENIYINDIQPVGERLVRCISVSSPSHLYLAGRGMVPTHNSLGAALYLLIRALSPLINPPPGYRVDKPEPELYWIVAADYDRTRREFEYLVEWFAQAGVLNKGRTTSVVNPGRIQLVDGTIIRTKSASDPRTLAMEAPNGILGVEASQLDIQTFERLRGRVGPKRGWLHLSGTFEESVGWYPTLWKAWQYGYDDSQSFSLPSTSNTYIYPGGENDPEILDIQRRQSDQYFMERIKGVPVPPVGLVFHEIRPDIHIREHKYIPDIPVYLSEDPGFGSDSAHAIVVWQVVDEPTLDGRSVFRQVRIVDEIYERGLITDQIIDIAMKRDWWKNDTKNYVTDPHYADQHHSQSSVADTWTERTGLTSQLRGRVPIMDGTERLKTFLKIDPLAGRPGVVIDPKCQGILSELGVAPSPFDGQVRAYRWGTDREGNVVGKKPEDRYNHSIKALIYGLVSRFGFVTSGGSDKVTVKRWR